ncbi:septum site-determining protein MinD [Myxosarcina sp. GI1]|uniref:septum site-determining protein MinD n=1 Tax=Myxosarcina sp. GI1 TaxID=1541065 RepID=UPI0005639765|nr:septum site-determining protein MinD [Myxosarcina sp. GI1]
MTRIIVVTSGKGGVGKTTFTSNIGAALASLDRKVALVDADFGLRNLDLLLGLEERVVYTALDVLAGDCRLNQALVKDKRLKGLVLLPAAQNRNKESVQPEQMQKIVDALTEEYDYVILDCPAGIELGFRNAIAAAKEALIVTTPEIAAVRDADRVIGLLEAEGIHKINLVVNRVKPAMVQSNKMMSVEDVLELLGVPLLGVIPDDEKVIVATNRGEPLVIGERDSLPAITINNIALRLEGEKVPFIDLIAYHESLLSRLRRIFGG